MRTPMAKGFGSMGTPEASSISKVRQWRRKQALRRTRARRPDMYEQLDLSAKQDKKLLKEMEAEDREQAGNSENMGAGE